MFRAVFICLVCILQVAAAPLVLKDDYYSPRNKERRPRKATTLIVLHTTEAHAKSSLNKLCERGEAHYCVVENGTVYRIIDRDREAFHAGRSMWNGKEDCDTYAIGIEVVGHHDQAVTLQQLDALRALLDKLKQAYKLKDWQVVCHSHVAYGAPNTWHKKKHRGRKRARGVRGAEHLAQEEAPRAQAVRHAVRDAERARQAGTDGASGRRP